MTRQLSVQSRRGRLAADDRMSRREWALRAQVSFGSRLDRLAMKPCRRQYACRLPLGNTRPVSGQ
jgi:hypothetical protein